MEHGLSTAEVISLQKKYGKNVIASTSSFSAVSLFFTQFISLINGILALAALVSFFISDVIDSIFILAVILLNAVIGFIQEYKAEKSLEKLKAYTSPIVRVLRNNREVELPSTDLLPGDLVIISEGDRVPADGRVLLSHHLESDESVLTGESVPVMKAVSDSVFMGMLITKGTGQFIVEAIGMETKFGKIAHTLSTIEDDDAPLRKQVDGLGKVITGFVICLSLLIIPFGVLYGHKLAPLLLTVMSICVSAIPESLPVIITIALAIGVTKMAKRQAFIRKMPAVETLGAMQYILVDKTGTLTQNAMRVKKYWLHDTHALKSLVKACILGNTSSLIETGSKHIFDVTGDKTDGALLLFSHETDAQLARELGQAKVLDEYVFDSDFKTITTVISDHGEKYVYVRGAPETVLAKSTVSAETKKEIQKQITAYAEEGLRVIAFGSKKEPRQERLSRIEAESHLTFLGIIGIYDPPRLEVRHSLQLAKNAGIRTIMVTGDNEITARAIGREIGLLEDDEDVITGQELASLSDAEVKELLPRIRIFARSLPEDKLRLVTLLKEQGFVVGVTGDGVNDSLALKKADVGIAMGKSGTDVAKEASDMVISDDNFASLISAIIEGRTIYHNIRVTITYLLASNFSELFFVFFAAVLNLPTPLFPTQILWINLITDGLPAIALASEGTRRHILKQAPRDPRVPILDRERTFLISSIALGLAALFLLSFVTAMYFFPENVARTIVFNILIFSHLGIAYLLRGKLSLSKSTLFIFMILGTIMLQILILLIPELRTLIHLEL